MRDARPRKRSHKKGGIRLPITVNVPTAAFPQVEHILDLLIGGLKPILQEQLLGVYLYGSLVTGDFDHEVSDIDLVVVLNDELDDRAFAQLNQLHTGVVKRNPEWHDRLELAYISQSALKTFRSQTSAIGIISPGEPFHCLEAGSDWLISWYALQEDGVALAGPPVQTLIDPISLNEYLQAVGEHISHYRYSVKKPQYKSALSYMVLTVARGVYTIHHGQPGSKIKAAAWAQMRFPRWSELIKNSLLWRENPQADSLTVERIRPHVEAYVNELLVWLAER